MSKREELLKILAYAKGQRLSGEVMAQQLGVSRVAVWKHVQALSDMGFPVESHGRRGYQMTVPMDASLQEFTAEKAGWREIHYFLHTQSTQALAKAGGTAGLPEGHLWVAETQSKGRGRLERRWESPYGGLWFSLLLRPRLPAAQIPALTLLAGLCLQMAIAKTVNVQAGLKWPNDLLVGRKKLAGILTEMSGQIDRTEWVVLGVGVNANNQIPDTLKLQATSLLEQSGRPTSRAAVLKSFIGVFRPAYARFQSEGFEPFRSAYWGRYHAPGKTVKIKTAEGRISGIATGVDASGAILIESRRKSRPISEGEIIL